MDPLRIIAAGEAATGVALTVFPRLVVELLFGGTEAGATGLAMSRIGGMALLALGIACWPETGTRSGAARARTALLVYSVLATIYLGALAMNGELRGALLWPAVVVHVVVTAVLVKAQATSPRAVMNVGGR
jgi:hypothetical protein